MVPLIAVVTCEKFKARADAQRETWVPKMQGADVKFFLAKQERSPLHDEVFLDVPDDYKTLPHKVRAAYRWALANGYTKVCKTDDDTYCHPTRLIAAIPSQDYVGFLNATPPKHWCSGFCYWLSERALNIVANAEIPGDEWAEDRWVGGVLFDHGIRPIYDPRYSLIIPGWRLPNFQTAVALCDCTGDNAHPTGNGTGPKTLAELQQMMG